MKYCADMILICASPTGINRYISLDSVMTRYTDFGGSLVREKHIQRESFDMSPLPVAVGHGLPFEFLVIF